MDDVRQVVGTGRPGGHRLRAGARSRVVVQVQDARRVPGEQAGVAAPRHDHLRAAVSEEEREALHWIGGVQGHVAPAGPQHAQQRDGQLRGALQEEPHPGLRPHAQGAQPPGEPLRPRLQLAEGEPRLPGDDRQCVGRSGGALGDQLVDALLLGIARRRPPPRREHGAPLVAARGQDSRERPIAVGGEAGQRGAHEVPASAGLAASVKRAAW